MFLEAVWAEPERSPVAPACMGGPRRAAELILGVTLPGLWASAFAHRRVGVRSGVISKSAYILVPLRLRKFYGHSHSAQIRSYVSGSGNRSPASSFRYSRTLTPTSQAARQTLRPSRFRERCIIPGYAAKVGMQAA